MVKPKAPLDKVLGTSIKVTSQEDAEKADFYICMPAITPALFADDIYDDCTKCGTRVRLRPHAPKAPKRLCMECALIQFGADDKATLEECDSFATEQVIAEVNRKGYNS